MRQLRKKILLIALTTLSVAAGVVAGLLAARVPASSAQAAPLPGTLERTPLVEELQLTPEQRDQMRSIWETIRGQVHQSFEDAQDLQKQRDDALVALLNDEQKAQFEKIARDYARRFDDLTRKRDEMFERGVERTKMILDESQRRKYDQILKTHVRREPSRSSGKSTPSDPPA